MARQLAAVGQAERVRLAARKGTWWLRPPPSFVIIGVPRAGTTSLHSWLSTHPLLSAAREKELHYLSSNWGRGWHWYRAQFGVRWRGRQAFEASPGTLSHPLAARRAAIRLPASRFLVLLREPVARLISHYRYFQQLGIEPASLLDALEREPALAEAGRERVLGGAPDLGYLAYAYRRIGNYAEQLSEWLTHNDAARCLIIESETMFRQPQIVYEAVLRWLDLPVVAGDLPALNASNSTGDLDPALITSLHEYYEAQNDRLFELLGRRLWSGADIFPFTPTPHR